MIVKCVKCKMFYDDEFRYTICPHKTFLANDGKNNFKVNEDAYLSKHNPAKTVRCTYCGTEFTDEELQNAHDCPTCHTTGIPCSIAEDVTIKINWHELRILGIWADNYAQSLHDESKGIVGKILQRIERQYPKMTPLTLAGEVKRLQEEYPGATLMQGGKVIVPPKKPN